LIRKGAHITKVGRLRHQLTIQNQTATPDGMGGSAITWANGPIVWADVMPISAI
jgi:head-tail adaptor